MGQILNISPIIAGQVLDADVHSRNFKNIQSVYNQHDKNSTYVHGIPENEEIGSVEYYTQMLNGIKPAGTVISIWDNEIPQVINTLDTDKWVLLDGATISDEDSLFNGETIPDATECYLIGSISTTIGKSGNVGNIKDLEHLHSYTHTHTFAHSHTVGNHYHEEDYKTYGIIFTRSTIGACIGRDEISGKKVVSFTSVVSGATSWSAGERANVDKGFVSTFTPNTATKVTLTTGNASTSVASEAAYQTTSSHTENTQDSLSSTQDIRPYSIKVKFYLRYK